MVGTDGKEYDNTDIILQCVHDYNETGDTAYLWQCRPQLSHCIKSIILKRFKGGWKMWGKDEWVYTDGIVDDITDKWMISIMKRREKGNPLEMRSPITYARWQVLSHYPSDDRIWRKTIMDTDELQIDDNGIIIAYGNQDSKRNNS